MWARSLMAIVCVYLFFCLIAWLILVYSINSLHRVYGAAHMLGIRPDKRMAGARCNSVAWIASMISFCNRRLWLTISYGDTFTAIVLCAFSMTTELHTNHHLTRHCVACNGCEWRTFPVRNVWNEQSNAEREREGGDSSNIHQCCVVRLTTVM